MKQKIQKRNNTIFVVVVIAGVLFFLFISSFFISKKTTVSKTQGETSRVSNDEDWQEKQRKEDLSFFLNENYKRYTTLQKEVEPQMIKQAFFLNLGTAGQQGWLLEVEKTPRVLTHWLITPDTEKELEHSTSCSSQDENLYAKVDSVRTVGVSETVVTQYRENGGYLILSGKQDGCYGGGDSGFISVYILPTGEKLRLQGNFDIPGSIWKGMSPSGNALGYLKGVYGVNNPTIVIDYGSDIGAPTPLESLKLTAYFDLQTGRLNQLVRFE